MKTKYLPLALCALGLVALGTGCAASNLTEFQKAIGNDQADLDVSLSTPWGTETIKRRGHPPVPAAPVQGTNAPLPALGTLPTP